MKNKIIQSTYIFLLIIFSCKNQTYYNEYAIVSAKKEATLAGIKILEMGGNAFDAMIAVDLALAVVYPNAGNLGGGGFLVYRDSKGNIGSLDYREKAPLRASEKMFLDNENNIIPNLSREGAFSVAVPGTPAGLFEIYQRFGSIPLDSIFKPALYLAKDGFKLTKRQANLFNSSKNKILELNNNIELFNNDFHEGFLFKNIQLYKTLLYLLENGLDSFYTGKNAEKIIEYLSSKGGIISQDDLVKYQPIWRDPFVFEYKDLKIITMGLPSSGGVVMNQILKSLNFLDQKSLFDSDLQYVRSLVELEKLSFADRSFYLGDPDFINDSFIDSIVSDNYLLSRFNNIDFENPKKSLEIKHGNINLNESDETTHYSIVDSFGNAVSVTTTLNSNFGSKLIPPSLGFFLNNEMDDFSIKSGYPNIYGLVGGENNSVVAEKRMLSSMTPTIIEKNNKTYMILGSPGGPTIITSILQTILNVSLFNMNIEEAVNRGRFHHIWLPDKIFYEINTFNEKTKNKLIDLGYKFADSFSSIGRVDAILIENNKIFTAPDPRGDDYSYGK
ncbi:gamma-glutamyltransferase [Flavobacteriales bacterium]|nr:gamma-glutamyltransferase [Flavobacteriales bacterium]